MSSTIRQDCVVGLVYDLRDEKDRLLETRTPDNPLYFIHGHQQILPALEKAILGQTPGYRTTLHLQADEAYGRYDNSLIAEMERRQFPQGIDIQVGIKFNTIGPGGKPLTVRVVSVEKNKVVVDGNHPLAGVALTFELLIHSVRPATPSEIQTGRVQIDLPGQLH